jgi:serine/threonine-protein kinase
MGAAETHRSAETIGRYEVVGRLATGGMAEILLGRLLGPSGFERPVVIKRILPHLAEQPAFVDMFLDEARLAARIQHKNVVQVHELGQQGQNLFLVMEYLEGENAAGIIRRSLVASRPLPVALCAYIVAEACAGLHAAHELTDANGHPLGLVHRDVSPQNIFVTYGGGVKVLDFGIAKAADRTAHTEVGQLKGKFEYMSPEQCRGKPIDRRSDVFALGIVLYELLTQKRLYKRSTKLAVLEAVCRDPTPPPSTIVPGCPESLDRIAQRALAKLPDERYANAGDMRRDLMGVVRDLLGSEDPEEKLAQVMSELFQDRVREKRDMLGRVRAGAEISTVPSAEADSGVEIPDVEGVVERPSTWPAPRNRLESGFTFGGSHAGSGVDAYAVEVARARRRLVVRLAGAASLILVLGVALIWWSMPRPNGVALRVAVASIVPPPSWTAKLEEPAAAAHPKEVTIQIVSQPAGATVLVGEEAKGITPLPLTLPKGNEPVPITLKLEGYEDATDKVTPDVDQRIRVPLTRAKAKTTGAGTQPPGGGTKPSGGDFHRFD